MESKLEKVFSQGQGRDGDPNFSIWAPPQPFPLSNTYLPHPPPWTSLVQAVVHEVIAQGKKALLPFPRPSSPPMLAQPRGLKHQSRPRDFLTLPSLKVEI